MCKVLAILMLLFSCSSSKTDDTPPPTLQQTALLYRQAGQLQLIPRCDRATFYEHARAVGVSADTAVLESPSGHLNRDRQPCFPAFSANESSREMYVGWLHDIWTHKDTAALDRLMAYGEAHNWVMGQGDDQVNDISLLVPIMEMMRAKMGGSLDATSAAIDSALSGFQGHVLASYLWLWLRVNEQIGPAGKTAVKSLYDSNPKDPIYSALWHRVGDGDFSETYGILSGGEFPADSVPVGVGDNGWGSCPDWLYFLLTQAIVKGI